VIDLYRAQRLSGVGPDGLTRAAAATLMLAVATPVLVVGAVAAFALFAPGLTILPPPPGPPAGEVSVVFDKDGQEIARFHEHDRYVPVAPGDLPDHLLEATVAAEDARFYAHEGIDVRGVLRALLADLQAGSVEQGGSTITQQYVKNAFTGADRTIARKLREAVLARRLEDELGKDAILHRYLSTIYFGNGAHGVGAAASVYFGKPVGALSVSESAVLVGLIPAPSRYDPRVSPEAAERKRVLVLDRMLEHGYLGPDEHARAVAARLWASGGTPPPGATVVRPPERADDRHPYFVDYLRRYLEARVGAEALRRGGLEIHTTLDEGVQAAAERAVAEAVAGVPPPLDMALAAVEPRTGFVRALVGGRDFDAPGGQVNLALGRCPDPSEGADVRARCWDEGVVVDGGGTGRQPGSSWKPFVLAAALEHGFRPTATYRAPASFRAPGCGDGEECVIENFGRRGYGRQTLQSATVRSINTVFAQVIGDVGVKAVGEMAKRLGISTAWVAEGRRHGVSYALGVQEVAPLEMASAYGVFAARGLRAPPTPVLLVRGGDGEILHDNRRRTPERVVSRSVAVAVTNVLEEVVERGTGRRAALDRPAAGKTGTSQAFRDAWFVGYTPQLSAAVWMGNRERAASLTGVAGHAVVTGGSIPAETWSRFIQVALEGRPALSFEYARGEESARAARRSDQAPRGAARPAPLRRRTTAAL
jgi:membrane peptidoglycan carboxypeptidase